MGDGGELTIKITLEVTPPQTSKELVDTVHGSEDKWAIELVPGTEP